MKSFAVLCAFALLGICLALGPKCRGKDPKMFEGLSKMEIAMICGDDDQSEGKQGRVARSISSGMRSVPIIQARGVARSGRIRRDVKISPVVAGRVSETGDSSQDTEKAILAGKYRIKRMPLKRPPRWKPRKMTRRRPIQESENA